MAPFGLVPLDVVGHCTEDARHVAAPERVVGGSDHFYALLSHERPLPSVAGGQRSEPTRARLASHSAACSATFELSLVWVLRRLRRIRLAAQATFPHARAASDPLARADCDWTRPLVGRMITPRARRPPVRHCDLPLHRRRGLDEAPALARRRGLRRGARRAPPHHPRGLRRAGGVEVDTQGDAFFFAFPTAPGALAAASAFTEALASGPVQVRVGLHTGTPLLTDEGYVGDDVHRAARIAACGHGGQVLVSSATASLVELELRRPRRAPAQGPLRPRAHLPARRRRVPGAQVALPHEPAGACDALPRPRAGARRGRRAPGRRRCSPPHPHRPRRDREDATRAAGGRSRLRRLPRRRVLGPARAACAIPRSCSRRRVRRSAPRTASPSTFRQDDALPLRQLRAGRGGRRPSSQHYWPSAPTSTCSSRAGSAFACRASRRIPCLHSPSQTARRSS